MQFDRHLSLCVQYPLHPPIYKFKIRTYVVSYEQIIRQSTWDIFHDEEDVGRRRYDLIELDDVWMTEEFHIFNFSSNFGHAILRLDSLSVNHFHGHVMTGQSVLPFLYLWE